MALHASAGDLEHSELVHEGRFGSLAAAGIPTSISSAILSLTPRRPALTTLTPKASKRALGASCLRSRYSERNANRPRSFRNACISATWSSEKAGGGVR